MLLNFSKEFGQYLVDHCYNLDRLLLIFTSKLSNDHGEDDPGLGKSSLSSVFFIWCICYLLHNPSTVKMLSYTFYTIPCFRCCSCWVFPRTKDTHGMFPRYFGAVICSSHCSSAILTEKNTRTPRNIFIDVLDPWQGKETLQRYTRLRHETHAKWSAQKTSHKHQKKL